MKGLLCLVLGWIYLGGASFAEALSPSVLYLTWMHDPTTTMTVQWHTKEDAPASRVFYRKMGEESWQEQGGVYTKIHKTNLLVHTVELDELDPDTKYQFELGKREETYLFQTLPKNLDRPMKFIIGGDAYFYLSKFKKMNQEIARQDPAFVVVGGDIAYTNNSRALFRDQDWELKRWRRFFKEWKEQMVTSDGRMIPIVPVLGNHDIRQISPAQKPRYFLFYELFALPNKGVSFRALDVGNYLTLLLLDTGHSYHIEGEQTKWLKRALSARENISYKLAVYHIGAYPSVYPYLGNAPQKIRSHWSPLFERYHLNAAFEHHNHAYKRSHPMKKELIDPDGVVYMGDGSWGVNPRKPKALWYLDKWAQVNAVCRVTLKSQSGLVQAVNNKGEIIDSWETSPTSRSTSCNESLFLLYE